MEYKDLVRDFAERKQTFNLSRAVKESIYQMRWFSFCVIKGRILLRNNKLRG